MPRNKPAFLAMFIILSIFTQPTLANPNLSYAVTVGDSFTFNFDYEGEFGTFTEFVSIQIRHLPAIPSTIQSIFDCTIWFDAEFFYLNDTQLEIAGYLFDPQYIRLTETGGVYGAGILAYIPRCLTVGNMTYLGELYAAWHRPYNTTILESENLWGVNIAGDVHRNISQIYSDFDISLNISADYTLEDGFLAHYTAKLTNLTSGTYYQYVSVNRIGLDSEVLNVVKTYASNTTPISAITEPTDTPTITTILEPSPQTETLPGDLTTINPYASTLNTVTILVWVGVIITLTLDFRRRKSSRI